VTSKITSLLSLLQEDAKLLLTANGVELIKRIGLDTTRQVVLDVLSGKNLRDSTEMLTRQRLITLNTALLDMLVQGEQLQNGFVANLPQIAEQVLKRKQLSKSERWVAQWCLGLTDKASQNVLRDDATLMAEYRRRYESIYEEVISHNLKVYGELSGHLRIGERVVETSWKFMLYLFGAIGAQTLTIRGSEKSLYGKIFERLVLGSLLSILGFQFTGQQGGIRFEKEFWLSSQGEKRESDATALWEAGKGARFDIGFIGRGNPEISLDKVTRFAREVELGRSTWYMATVIIVDRIGKKSKIPELARRVDGDIVQMSLAYWPQEVAQILHRRMDFDHPLVSMERAQIGTYLANAIKSVPLEKFLPATPSGQE